MEGPDQDTRRVAVNDTILVAESGRLSIEGQEVQLDRYPAVLLPAAIVVFGDKVNEGQLVEGVAVPWFEILRELARNPEFLFQIGWRQLEEFLAGAYERAGWPEVILTPRSHDGGRDIIATKPGMGSIRLFDQVKAYKPGHLVTADEVRSMLGTLAVHRNVSKGIITTTSRFAPGVDQTFKELMPYRLELKNGAQLLLWLAALRSAAPPSGPSPERP